MNWKHMRKASKILPILLIYGYVFLYTITFPSNTSWFLFYFSSWLLVFNFLTVLFRWRSMKLKEVSHMDDHTLQLVLQARTWFFLPVLLPELTFMIQVQDKQFPVRQSALFRTRFIVRFDGVRLKRGHYPTLSVVTQGKDFLNFFTHRSVFRATANLDVFPDVLPSRIWLPVRRRIEQKIQRARYQGTDNYHFHQIRDYRVQDALKDIDWKSSVRRQNWMVKEYENEKEPSLFVFFYGITSPFFEQLLALTYSIVENYRPALKVDFRLAGDFSGHVQTEKTSTAFVAIQPASDETALHRELAHLTERIGLVLLVVPAAAAVHLPIRQLKNAVIITEKDFLL